MTLDQVSFAGGEGQSIRKSTIKYLRAFAEKEAGIGNQVIHPDAILPFVADLMAEIGASRFRAPVILTRK